MALRIRDTHPACTSPVQPGSGPRTPTCFQTNSNSQNKYTCPGFLPLKALTQSTRWPDQVDRLLADNLWILYNFGKLDSLPEM